MAPLDSWNLCRCHSWDPIDDPCCLHLLGNSKLDWIGHRSSIPNQRLCRRYHRPLPQCCCLYRRNCPWGIQAVPIGQMEASRSLGISYGKTMRKIILPQATKLMLPNFVNQFVIALKDTTIVSAIGLVELFQTGKIIIARNYQSFKMYAILAVFYLVIITLLTRFAKN